MAADEEVTIIKKAFTTIKRGKETDMTTYETLKRGLEIGLLHDDNEPTDTQGYSWEGVVSGYGLNAFYADNIYNEEDKLINIAKQIDNNELYIDIDALSNDILYVASY